jgi:hypothetical protein
MAKEKGLLRQVSGTSARASWSRRSQGDEDTALLIAALDHSWTTLDARLNRGLQVVNYYLVAAAILANAYVSAFNAKLYTVAAVIGLSGLALTMVTFAVGFRQRRLAHFSEFALIELQDRLADRLGISALRLHEEVPRAFTFSKTPYSYIAFVLAALLSAGAVPYALIH